MSASNDAIVSGLLLLAELLLMLFLLHAEWLPMLHLLLFFWLLSLL
jgi:hypothetical protein